MMPCRSVVDNALGILHDFMRLVTNIRRRDPYGAFLVFLASLATFALYSLGCSRSETTTGHKIDDGAGFFYFRDKAISSGSAMRVFYYRPKSFTVYSQILFFMHGADRKAEHIPRIAADALEKLNILLIVPEFSEELFPKIDSYQYGSVRTKPRELWSFFVNDRIFKFVRRITDTRQSKYYIWGNSAGAQFVHRQILVGAHEFIQKAFASNAGVYTLPTNGRDPYPYSIKGLGLTSMELKGVFLLNLFVLLGEEDVVQDAYFLKSEAAMRQGGNRFQRGKLFYSTAESEARARGLTFNWKLLTFPECGHEPNDEMMEKVISLITDSRN
jgi:hypothetical protein